MRLSVNKKNNQFWTINSAENVIGVLFVLSISRFYQSCRCLTWHWNLAAIPLFNWYRYHRILPQLHLFRFHFSLIRLVFVYVIGPLMNNPFSFFLFILQHLAANISLRSDGSLELMHFYSVVFVEIDRLSAWRYE